MMAATNLPRISHVLETCLYVKDLPAATGYYKNILQTEPFMVNDRGSGFALGQTTLLLFKLGATTSDMNTPTGTIAKHGPTESVLQSLLPSSSSFSSADDKSGSRSPSLRQHFCLAVPSPDDVSKWDAHFQEQGVKILSRMEWERGGRSVYFEDLDGHVGEIGSRGIWAHYPVE